MKTLMFALEHRLTAKSLFVCSSILLGASPPPQKKRLERPPHLHPLENCLLLDPPPLPSEFSLPSVCWAGGRVRIFSGTPHYSGYHKNLIQQLFNIYFRLGGFQSSLLFIYFRYGAYTCSHYNEEWQKPFRYILKDSLSRSLRRVFAVLQKSRRNHRSVSKNRSHTLHGFACRLKSYQLTCGHSLIIITGLMYIWSLNRITSCLKRTAPLDLGSSNRTTKKTMCCIILASTQYTVSTKLSVHYTTI